ncbi:hypothetical protein BD560DRAFT_386905 [Blakeslea trispora]|nr:hypothetical protein BD560DRAFT_386905 [Blakeslea trispora]
MKSITFLCLFIVFTVFAESLEIVRSTLHGPCGRTNQFDGTVTYYECSQGFHCVNYLCYEDPLVSQISSVASASESMA